MKWQHHPDGSGASSLDHAGPIERGRANEGYTELTDASLMAAVRAGDADALAALYDRYAPVVFSAALRVLSDRGLAEDVTQDVFVRLWRRPESFVAERGRFVSWLMSVTRNRSVDEVRSRGRRQKREAFHQGGGDGDGDEDPTLHVPTECREDDPVRCAQLHEQQAHVRSALLEIPTEQRMALEMAYFGGMTQQEISVALGEPLGTVKTRIRLGMQKLRRALAGKV